jgi:arginyl-tRNA synthetase
VDALIKRARTLLGDADYRLVFNAGLEWCLADIKADLEEFNVHHDEFFSERSLSTTGAIQHAIDRLTEAGHMYESEGALWFRATRSATRRTAWWCARTAPARTSPRTSPTC